MLHHSPLTFRWSIFFLHPLIYQERGQEKACQESCTPTSRNRVDPPTRKAVCVFPAVGKGGNDRKQNVFSAWATPSLDRPTPRYRTSVTSVIPMVSDEAARGLLIDGVLYLLRRVLRPGFVDRWSALPSYTRSTIEVALFRENIFWVTGVLNPKLSEGRSCFEKRRNCIPGILLDPFYARGSTFPLFCF